MKIHYLEIVCSDVESTCRTYSAVHGVDFADPDPSLGNARTATLDNGTILGIRASLSDAETPIIRPYALVDNLDVAVEKSAQAGAEVLLPFMELPGHGHCAIILDSGVQLGLWQI